MPTTEQFQTIIIGSGQGGTPLARALAHAGWKTALIEREHVGGTCVNEGCQPTKTMIASAHAAYVARRGADFGVRTGEVTVDMARVRQRKRDIVASFRGHDEQRIRDAAPALELLMGEARFAGPYAIEVRLNDGGTRLLTANQVFINTGARTERPPIPGVESVPSLNSTTIMELDAVPEHLVILGGGYIAVEFGQMFRRFGSRVTIVQRGAQLLGREDEDVAQAVAQILRDEGVEIVFNAKAQAMQQGNDGRIILAVAGPEGERALSGTHVLVATGRTPNTDRLNLPAAGVAMDERGFVRVNERLETNVPGVYAIGDVKGGPAFTHISYDDFRIIRTNLLEGGRATTTNRMVPYTLFIDPELGRVGLTEAEARAGGRRVRVAKMPMTSVARALDVDESRGFMKAVVDADTGQVLGAAILGLEGGELMAMLEIAMLGKLPYACLRDATFAHPTLAESLNTLFANFTDGQP
jgi:pyruvate/2-oxoglutarate dehydrogenase complex dihydrolipoamide dehydrogenase (E3) component